jgi:MAP/microtubule affinity-regulating kinase
MNIITSSDISHGKVIGNGNFAKITEGTYKTIRVAVKTLSPKYINEIVILSKLKHPNIINTIGYFGTETHFGIVMELAEKDLASFSMPLPPSDVFDYTTQIATAIEYIHSKDINHGDIKIENILMVQTKSGLQPKLADFGFACTTDAQYTEKMRGTPMYMSPEMIKMVYKQWGWSGYMNHPLPDRFASDMWAFGVVIYMMATGNVPFKGDELKQYFANVINFEIEPYNACLEIETLIDGLLAPESTASGSSDQRSVPEIDFAGSCASCSNIDFMTNGHKIDSPSKRLTPSNILDIIRPKRRRSLRLMR